MVNFKTALAAIIIIYFGSVVLFWLYGNPVAFGVLERIQGVPSVWGPWKTHPYAHTPLPFVDLGGILSWRECYLRGVDVAVTNPCDIISRGPANYSPVVWHLPFELLGLRNPIPAALALDSVFLAVAFFMFHPRSLSELVIVALAIISPAVFYALERANLDLLVFVAMVCSLFLPQRQSGSRMMFYGAATGAGLLKLYPFTLLATLVREPIKRCLILAFMASLTIAAFVTGHWTFFTHLALPKEDIFGMFGGPILPKGLQEYLGLPAHSRTIIYISCCLLSFFGMFALFRRIKGDPKFLDTLDDASGLILCGGILILACFFSGFSVYYRAIFLLPVLAGFLSLRNTFDTRAMRKLVQFGILATLMCLYGDMFRFFGMAAILSGIFIEPSSVMGKVLAIAILVGKETLWWLEITMLGGIVAAFLIRGRAVTDFRKLILPMQQRFSSATAAAPTIQD